MSDYTKISIPFKERLLFLFTGLIDSKHIISKNVNISKGNDTDGSDLPIDEIVISKDTVFEGESIPFFSLENDNTKSNL